MEKEVVILSSSKKVVLNFNGANVLTYDEYMSSVDVYFKEFNDKLIWLKSSSMYDLDFAGYLPDEFNYFGKIRPVLIIENNTDYCLIPRGEQFSFKNKKFTVISEKYAICDFCIAKYKPLYIEDWTEYYDNFVEDDETGNVYLDYENSKMKNIVDNWYLKIIK